MKPSDIIRWSAKRGRALIAALLFVPWAGPPSEHGGAARAALYMPQEPVKVRGIQLGVINRHNKPEAYFTLAGGDDAEETAKTLETLREFLSK
jgi:hypothetical protein